MNGFPSKSLSDNRKSAIQNRKWAGLSAIVVALMVCWVRAEAQQPTVLPRIGYLTGNPFSNSPARTEALRQRLRELGYEERENISLSGARRKENSIASPRLRASS